MTDSVKRQPGRPCSPWVPKALDLLRKSDGPLTLDELAVALGIKEQRHQVTMLRRGLRKAARSGTVLELGRAIRDESTLWQMLEPVGDEEPSALLRASRGVAVMAKDVLQRALAGVEVDVDALEQGVRRSITQS